MSHQERIVHQVWFDLGGGSEPPQKYRRWQTQMLKDNPGWKLMQWDRAGSEAFIRERFPWFEATFNDYADDIIRIDAIRYLVLYYFGGVYIDMDVRMVEKLDKIVGKEPRFVVLTQSPTLVSASINNFFMASPRRHPLMRFAVERLGTRGTCTMLNVRDSFVGTLGMAGPLFLNDVYSDYVDACRESGTHPQAWLTNAHAFDENPPKEVWHLGVHLYDAGWSSDTKRRGDLVRLLSVICVVVGVIVVYKTAGPAWAAAFAALVCGSVVLGIDASLQSCRRTPKRFIDAGLSELEAMDPFLEIARPK
jgi:hypothetical protein